MPTLLKDFIKEVFPDMGATIQQQYDEMIEDLSANPPMPSNVSDSEHYYDMYKCGHRQTMLSSVKKGILDMVFDDKSIVAPLLHAPIMYQSIQPPTASNLKKLDELLQKLFIIKYALLFSVTKIGNCAERTNYAALLLFKMFKGSDIKVALQSAKTKDHICILLGNKNRGWKVYDPRVNPLVLFDLEFHQENILPLFEQKKTALGNIKLVINNGLERLFLEQKASIRFFMHEELTGKTPEMLMSDLTFSLFLDDCGCDWQTLLDTHANLLRLCPKEAPTPNPV
jgi:hypothetical protein